MARTLLVTNDFPPTVGGIQSYVRDFVATLDPSEVIVFASTQDAALAAEYDRQAEYKVVRWPRRVMLPTPATSRRMAEIIAQEKIDTVWFGAAAPLALMAHNARRAGARKIIASTHGHEVGWSMIPGARQVLRRIGNTVDVVTFISEYTLRRFRSAFGPHPEFVHLPSGVDVDLFTPATAQERVDTRSGMNLGPDQPVVACISRLVPRKGQDQLIRALPQLRREFPSVRLLIIGRGRDERRLRRLATASGVDDLVVFAGSLPFDQMRAVLSAADVFAMPARTRGKGLDVEGLGIVYLEAQASGVPVVAGTSGGAPETVTEETGVVVDGRDLSALTEALRGLLGDVDRRRAMGAAGRANVEKHWTWQIMGQRLRSLV
ncbi:GDP-mannose-dependent alpha-(1-6)-phosphatidylinositol monomannoside mannosyltransferase [Corynebacterium atrinae]|uniref:glycosyltransferase family 4 protein n=1 Tax=Corynebacterium atrinae TaxID=1336740 RepID=UPI0025B4EA99|nr:glycosyltransferase family 4 protein [Corynebacterium atrinae]WJY63836.1 GDP-mannose-dependent alpha-(1-6)-phosphatidylinositol monomannoside mannosyltransferase [Corynebacterium atrinae]